MGGTKLGGTSTTTRHSRFIRSRRRRNNGADKSACVSRLTMKRERARRTLLLLPSVDSRRNVGPI